MSVTPVEERGDESSAFLFLNPSCVCIFLNCIFCRRTLDCGEHLHKRMCARITVSQLRRKSACGGSLDAIRSGVTGPLIGVLGKSPATSFLSSLQTTTEPRKPARESRYYLCFLHVTSTPGEWKWEEVHRQHMRVWM